MYVAKNTSEDEVKAEIFAMEKVTEALSPLSAAQAKNVLRWANSRFGQPATRFGGSTRDSRNRDELLED